MENLPIDIHYNKLLDWLVDRRHCTLKWQQSAASVKDMVNVAMQDISNVEEVKEILSGSGINYFTCVKIIEFWKQSGEGSKNMFGQYSSQKMKHWSEILQLYEKENTHLAEAAHTLMRNVNYEIPSLKKQIGKCQQTQRDCTRKESEYIANAATFKEKYLNECKQMGVKGENVKKELLQLVDELPVLFKEVAEDTTSLETSLKYYSDFVDFVLSKSTLTHVVKQESSQKNMCPMLEFICKYGNATVYQWRKGTVPKEIQKENSAGDSDAVSNDTEIEWGVNDLTNPTNVGIDFGDDAIDFGDDAVDFGNGDIDFGDGDIDFGIETVDESNSQKPENSAIAGDVSGAGDESIAFGVDALSVLANGQTRNLFIDELIEIQSFLFQRLEELSSAGDILSAKQFQSAPAAIQMQSKEKIEQMHSQASKLISEITSTKMQNLYRLKSSSHYVDRLADSLHQKLKTANNLLRQARAVVERKESAKNLQLETEPRLQKLIMRTKELKMKIQDEISKKYKNRQVNIMGEINSI